MTLYNASTSSPSSADANSRLSVQPLVYRQANYSAINKNNRLQSDPKLCLNSVFTEFDCALCQQECPVDAIDFSNGSLPEVTQACIDCGRCAAVCPTASFNHPDFNMPQLESNPVLYIECQQVPAEHIAANSWRVPCIGGIKTSQLLELAGQFEAVEIKDRGLCAVCPSGASQCDWRLVHHQAWSQLNALGMEESLTLSVEPLASGITKPKMSQKTEAVDSPNMTRRGLFTNLLKRTSSRPTSDSQVKALLNPTHRLVAVERRAQIQQLKRFSAQTQLSLSAFLPALEVQTNCCDHQVCRSACPTGAIFGYEKDGDRGLVFHSSQCIACGLCAQVCPEQQLNFKTYGGSLQPKALTRHEQRECFECGQVFSSNEPDDETLPVCTNCQKDTHLFQTLWR